MMLSWNLLQVSLMKKAALKFLKAVNLRRSLMLSKTQAGWKLCRKSFFISKFKMSGLWLIVLKGSDPLEQNRFSRTRRMKEELLSEIRPG
uniref:Uncharacterized protein n=1 Tax=Tanacetum cinerariifolium TaxID=118510 RepID=A0A699TNZ2_TANCI|nr:hypothetical protein [Tanacetum cinerariifolium]